MAQGFHDQEFGEGTQIKLDVFRRYLHAWLPVFMRKSSVNIFDLFCGPGTDKEGNPGSPIIILEEVKACCQNIGGLNAQRPIRLFFSDKNAANIQNLEREVQKARCAQGCCQIDIASRDFASALAMHLPKMREKNAANLVIMDQFGVSDVTPKEVRQLAGCNRTDILFFIPSSHVLRFRNAPSFKSKIDISEQNIQYNTIHRHICRYFEEQLGDVQFYLSPFSIKDGKDIHGIIFGSGHLLGLEKFLRVCWDCDPSTGEANYAIDKDPAWGRRDEFIPGLDNLRKEDAFVEQLKGFIATAYPNNLDMYRFVLTKGYTPTKAGELLRVLQKNGLMEVVSLGGEKNPRAGAFYLRHNAVASIRFKMRTMDVV
jgi:three-Cys-motif partner protein